VANGEQPTANQIRGRARGGLFFAGFGTLWIVLALYTKQVVTPLNLGLVSTNLALLLMAVFWLFRRSKSFATVPQDAAVNRAFNRINIAQWAAIFVVSFSFNKLHWDDFALSAIAAIVGLHLFPLAKLFHHRMHYATGVALLAWAVVSAVFVPRDQILGTTSLGTGILLCVSSWITLLLAMHAARLRR